ncbi:MAG: hypothetical protein ACK41D_03085 [Rubricoccaceae bacterium]
MPRSPRTEVPKASEARGAEARGAEARGAEARGAEVRGAEVRPVAALGSTERETLRRLMEAHYEGVCPEVFARDLDAKDAVVLLRDDAGALRGFSTVARERVRAGELEALVFYSGDTVVEAAHRHTAALPRAWSRYVFAEARRMPDVPTYWFLICSGYKTYRFLPTFYRRFLPGPGQPEREDERRLLDAVARARFGTRYNARTGVIRLEHPTPLRPGVADLTAHRLADPHVAFFAARNPGHARGDELACLCRIHPENLTPAGARMVGPDLARPLPAPP